MTTITNRARGIVLASVGLAAVFVAMFSSAAHAAAQDYSTLTSGFAAELGAALPVGLAAVGLFIGVLLAYKVVRRILSA